MVGKVATFKDCGWFLLKSAKDQFLGVDSEKKRRKEAERG
jgi:hypothetical protein